MSVIFTLRDDFLGRMAEGPQARAVLSRLTVIRSPVAETLAETLVKPLERVGYGFEDARMVDEMVAEVAGEPACLPLLQFACQMLWERRAQGARLLGLSNALHDSLLHNTGLIAPAKAALEMYVRQLAMELGPKGYRVNLLKFPTVVTPALSTVLGPEGMAQVGAITTHKLPARQLKYIFIAVMFYMGLKMLGVFEWLGWPL